MKQILPIISSLLLGFGGGTYLAKSTESAPAMPAPSKPDASPLPTGPNEGKTISVTRFEVVDSKGVVAVVFTVKNGVPIAIVNVNGKAVELDLAKLAKRVG